MNKGINKFKHQALYVSIVLGIHKFQLSRNFFLRFYENHIVNANKTIYFPVSADAAIIIVRSPSIT